MILAEDTHEYGRNKCISIIVEMVREVSRKYLLSAACRRHNDHD